MSKYKDVSHLYITRLKEREDTAVVAIEDILRVIGSRPHRKEYTNADISEVTFSSDSNLIVTTSDGVRHLYQQSYIPFERGLLFLEHTIEQSKRSRS